MNYKEFAKKYLEHVGAFDPDSNYGGMLGGAITALVDEHSKEGHSGMSAAIVNEVFYDLNNAYSGEGRYKNNRHKLWDDFWASPEGQLLQKNAGTPGVMDNPNTK